MSTVHVENKDSETRSDAYICSNFKIHSRSFLIKNWEELVTINGKKMKPSYKLREGDEVSVNEDIVDGLLAKSSYDKIVLQNYPLEIVYESDSYIVLNKPAGIAVHPGVGNTDGTLANFVAGYLSKKGEYDSTIDRAGVVHRLDKPVSGLIIFAKNTPTQKYLQKQFEKHEVQKIYYSEIVLKENTSKEVFPLIPKKVINPVDVINEFIQSEEKCLSNGWLKVEGYIGRSSLNRRKMIFKPYPFDHAKSALTYIRFLSEKEVLVVIKTGRMYQIRASLEYLGIHIKGDSLFQTLKGGDTPQKIALKSVFLSFEEPSGKLAIHRLL